MLLKRRPAAIMRGGKKKQQKTQDMIKPKKKTKQMIWNSPLCLQKILH